MLAVIHTMRLSSYSRQFGQENRLLREASSQEARVCMKIFSAGILAGASAGCLFLPLQLLVLFLAVGGRFDLQNTAYRLLELPGVSGLGLSMQTVIALILLGFVSISLLCSGLGAVLGVVFVKVASRLPIRSNYPKSLALGGILYLFVSLASFVFSHALPDIYLLVVIVLDSLFFGFLFTRWTSQGTQLLLRPGRKPSDRRD
jgi:hypothetical protein